jgi:hypothetical protein
MITQIPKELKIDQVSPVKGSSGLVARPVVRSFHLMEVIQSNE